MEQPLKAPLTRRTFLAGGAVAATAAGLALAGCGGGETPKEEPKQDAGTDATLTLPRLGMFDILKNDTEAQAKNIQVEGDPDVLKKLTEHLVDFDFFFNIVEPQK